MQNKTEILIPETSSHVYNRANGSEKLFRSAENYRYFLEKYHEYISPVADTFCYCLMPNHFHFLIRIKPETVLVEHFNSLQRQSATLQVKTLEGLPKQEAISKLLNQQFSNFFNGYTQAFNKQHMRKGSLFMHPFKRKKISDRDYLFKLIHYIHYNPLEANLCNHITDWPYSSYQEILSETSFFLKKEEVIDWFNNKENFIHFHSQQVEKETTAQ